MFRETPFLSAWDFTAQLFLLPFSTLFLNTFSIANVIFTVVITCIFNPLRIFFLTEFPFSLYPLLVFIIVFFLISKAFFTIFLVVDLFFNIGHALHFLRNGMLSNFFTRLHIYN